MEAPKLLPHASAGQPDSALHFLDYWRVIRIRKTVILAVFLLVVLTTTAVTLMLPQTFMSSVRIRVEKDVSDITPMMNMQQSMVYDPYFIQTEFETLKSKSVLHRVLTNAPIHGGSTLLERFSARYRKGEPLTISEGYQILSSMVDVRQPRNTSLVEVRVFSSAEEDAAKEASDIANSIADVYRESRLEVRRSATLRGILTLSNEYVIQQKDVEKVQREIDELKKELLIPDFMPESQFSQTLEQETVRRFEQERIAVKAQYNQLQTLASELENLRSKGREKLAKALLTAWPDTELGKLMQDLYFAEASLAKEGTVYGRQHPVIRQLAAMQADLVEKVDSKIDGIMEGLKLRVKAKKVEFDTLEQAVEDAKRKDAEMTEKYRPYFVKKRELENLQKIRDTTQVKILAETVDLALPKTKMAEITDWAEPASKAVRPNIPLNITLGVIVGLVVGVGLAFFIEYLDTSVKTIDDVERALQAPVLGVIPQNVGSLVEEGPESPHAEAYRVLRTNLLFSRKNESANTLTVVSGGAGEGKSTTIFNLCTVFAQNGHRVLLVDSDLRRPSLHKFFKVSNTIGLTNFLLGQSKLEEVVQTTKIPTFDFLPSGKLPSSSLGILNSPQMREFIKEVKQRYDYVFFDSPPIMGVSDASVLASMVDLTILVIQYRKYPQAMTIRAKQMVEKIGGNLIGVVLNNINISQDSYYYYYSGYYYDYYSKSDDSRKKGAPGSAVKEDRAPRSEVEIKQKY